MDYEVKAGTLEESFRAMEEAPIGAVERPILAGNGESGGGVAADFLRRGIAGVEMKSVSGVAPAQGGYALPRRSMSASTRL